MTATHVAALVGCLLLAGPSVRAQPPPAAPDEVQRLVGELWSDIPERAEAAATALGRLGEAASPAVPDLIETMWWGVLDSDLRAQTLARIGKPAIDAIAKVAAGDDADRRGAAYLLAQVGRYAAEGALTAFDALLLDANPAAAKGFAEAADDLVQFSELPVTLLIPVLEYKSAAMRGLAANALREVHREKLTGHVQALVDIAERSDDSVVRSAVTAALAEVGKGQGVVESIVARLRDPDARTRAEAAKGLRYVTAAEGQAESALPLLGDPDPVVRAEASATLTLWGYGQQTRPVVLALLREHPTEDDDVAIPALNAAEDLHMDAELGAFLADWLLHGNHDAQRIALARMWRLSPAARDAAPAVVEFMRREEAAHQSGPCRFDSPPEGGCTALASGIGILVVIAPGRETAEFAASHTRHVMPCVRRAAASALGRLGDLEVGVPALKPLLEDRTAAVRIAAAGSLWRLGEAGAARPVVRESLDPADPEEVRSACYALEAIGPDAREFGPRLMELAVAGVAVSTVAAALGHLGVTDAIPLLRGLLAANGKDVADTVAAAAAALIRLGEPEAAASVVRDLIPRGCWRSEWLLTAIREAGPSAAPLAPVLESMLDSLDPAKAREVREAVAASGAH